MRILLPFLLFVLLLIHGSSIGLSDDEAYYWVLAQKLSFGYAYHPPAVAGFIAFFQFLLGGIFDSHISGLVRLPAALGSSLIFGMSLAWLRDLGLQARDEVKAAAVLLSFFGFFSLSWMMVPDIPLFLGWMILFTQCWKLCSEKPTNKNYWGLCLGVTLTLLSKYSGILVVSSAFISLCIWAPRARLAPCLGFLFLGGLFGILPTIAWNYSHEWVSLLYQIRDRHEGSSISLLRYLRFWGIECILAGPLVIAYFFNLLGRFVKRLSRKNHTRDVHQKVESYLLTWILPAAGVFCVQPLFSDFKPHWAFIVWWPVVLSLAFLLIVKKSSWTWLKFQSFYGLTLGIFVLASCHFPIGTWIARSASHVPGSVGSFDPRLDVTNDFYGWNELESFIKMNWGGSYASLPVIGSRYQTASQARFNLSGMRVTLLPRDLKERDEWPDLGVSDGQGPAWPKLTTEILFVADNRYDSGPQFPSANCEQLGRFEKSRFNLLAKWITIWHCAPGKI
ncbi:MAG: hypothetical protein ABIQ95_07350 [Bdellovibrionia bacterium]